jgi:hypothetical protein
MLALIAAWALSGEGFFGGRELDFWGTRRAAPRPAAEAELWADSTAPAPVKRLLDAPTAGNARAYLDWQAARLRRLREAVEAVEAAGLRPAEAAAAAAALAARPPGEAILYFSRPGCRWCVLQDRELEGLPVVRVPEGSPLWERHGIEATPTLVVRGRALRGFTPRARIERELARE